ncbi:MAG TPA: DUF1302 family protein [Nitrospiria bacterium]
MLGLDLGWVRLFFPILWIILFIEIIPTPLMASEEGSKGTFPLQYGGFFKNETAFRFGHTATFTKVLNIFELQTQYALLPSVRLTGIGRAFFDGIYSLKKEDTIRGREDTTGETFDLTDSGIDLKEGYADITTSRIDFRIGKQIVRWGILEGFRITDEINPLDFKEFILKGVEDRYRALWLLKGEYFGDDWNTQVIWIPDLRFHKPAPAGSEWEEFQLPPSISEPPLTLENTEIGIRLSRDMWGGDGAFSFFYTWDDFPAAFRSVFGFGGNLDSVNFTPRYSRVKIWGLSYSKSFGGVVIGGEGAYVTGKFFGTEPDPSSLSENEIERDLFKYGFLVDFSMGETDVSLQFSQQIIPDHQSAILQKPFESAFSLFLRRELLYKRWVIEMLMLYFTAYTEFVIRPKIRYQMTDHLLATVGADFFEGPESGNGPGEFRFVGFFRNQDRVFAEIKYSF